LILASPQKQRKKDTIEPSIKKTAKKSHTEEEIITFKFTMMTTAPNTNMPST
jgi:hypothetical protein